MERTESLLKNDRFAGVLGARLVEREEGRLVVEMEVLPQHRDRNGRPAPGVLFSLADCAMSLISNRSQTEVAIATDLSCSLGDADVLRAEIVAVGRGDGRSHTWQATVMADGVPMAVFTGTTLAV